MSTSNIYSQLGLVIPHKNDAVQEWCVPGETFHSQGFLHVCNPRYNLHVVQSNTKKELFIIKLLRTTADPDDSDGFSYDLPPEIRVSIAPQALVQLPEAGYFPNLVMWQKWNDSQWALYTQFYNGGTIRDMIDEYYNRGDAIPEHFIWHFIERMGEALVYLHLGRPHGTSGPDTSSAVPGWRPVYHRDISDSNIYLHYPRAGRSQILKAKYNAFPQIVLGDFGDSAIQGDDPAQLPTGVFPASTIRPNLNEWTDVHQFGCVLRRMCMTHIPEDTNEDEDDDDENVDQKEESESKEEEEDFDTWALHRPESHTLQFCNTFLNGQVYSDTLVSLLQGFERPNMNKIAVTDEPNLVPSIAWVAGTLLPEARRQLQQCREPVVPSVAYFNNLDVSWTKPVTLAPFSIVQGSAESMRGLKRVREEAYGAGMFDRPRPRIQRLEMGPPTFSRNDGYENDVPEDMWENL
ncbi:hypothetical protein VMCG_06697 [Cytospora schulzeri]|uniref:non-specific serine/threonine protein kinase n=1 Tax=Cytospora schulzeri TaxID=448051 RepID=A0A423W6Y4_9PEZI|nr:hypothetical protein VMCG_06697 [Valsa malicola]